MRRGPRTYIVSFKRLTGDEETIDVKIQRNTRTAAKQWARAKLRNLGHDVREWVTLSVDLFRG